MKTSKFGRQLVLWMALGDGTLNANGYLSIRHSDKQKEYLQWKHDILKENGLSTSKYNDCGLIIFDNKKQDTHSGGSGCGCSALVLCAYTLDEMKKKTIKRVLFAGTGALMSPLSTQQGESIPSIAHAVAISNER